MMIKVHSKALDKSIDVGRIIGHLKGEEEGPTLIFIGGLHGNEPSGVFALHNVFRHIRKENIKVRGSVYALAGNLPALEKGVRYSHSDLNRLWTEATMQKVISSDYYPENEDEGQLLEIYEVIESILKKERGPFYFMDLHTTSSKTIPFTLVNDSLLNRKFVKQYPVPMVLGIEEYLEGPVLSYVNSLGYIAFGYESGQHDGLDAIENHIAFIYLTMAFCASVQKTDIDFSLCHSRLTKSAKGLDAVYEIFYDHSLKKIATFEMLPGFTNFQHIEKNQNLAIADGDMLYAKKKGQIFMPLYQNRGDEGFFVIRKVPEFFLWLSKVLRNIKWNRILALLPGVHRDTNTKTKLIVNRSIARFFVKQIFHLLGYRNRYVDGTHLILNNREENARYSEYPKKIFCFK